MELAGAKQCFEYLVSAGLKVAVFVSDRHRGIAKWIRECYPEVAHFYDIWHVARSINKKLLSTCKEKGCEILQHWIKAVRNHIYWCATTTKQGFASMILAKWNSFMRHVADYHEDHPNKLYPTCAHDSLQRRKWIKIGIVLKQLDFSFKSRTIDTFEIF